MDYLSDVPRHEIHDLMAPSKISGPVEDPSDKDWVEPSAPLMPDSKENGHADPRVPAQSFEYQASDHDEKRLFSSETSLPVPPSEAVGSVEKVDQLVDQESVETSTAAAKPSKCEDELESPAQPEVIDQRDGGECDLLDPGKRDFEEPEPIADRGFESSPEAVAPIMPSDGRCAPEQQDMQEANTEATEIRPINEFQASRGCGDPIDHVPVEMVETLTEPMSNAAKDAETATSADTEQKEVKDRNDCLTETTASEAVAVEGGDGSYCRDQVVDVIEIPEATLEIGKDDTVPDQIPIVETVDESTSCKSDDPKATSDDVIEPSGSQNIEVERSYPADDGGKDESIVKENIVDEKTCSFDESAPASDDRVKEESAEDERSAPAEQNVTGAPCDDKKLEGHEAIESSGGASQTLADQQRCNPLSDEPVREVDAEESPASTEEDNHGSYSIDEATPAAVEDQREEEFAEPDQKPATVEENEGETTYDIESTRAKSVDDQTNEVDSVIEPVPATQTVEVERSFQLADESVKEDASEDGPAAENENGAIERSCKIESTPVADLEGTDEFLDPEKSSPNEENVDKLLYNLDECAPAVRDDHHTKEDDEVLEPSTPQILEVDRISHSNELVKEDAVEEPPAHDMVEGNRHIESAPAGASDVEFVQKLENPSPVIEENVSEASLHKIKSTTHTATAYDDQIEKRFTEADNLSVNDRSYSIESAIPSSCDDQSVDQDESQDQKTESEAPEDEIKSEVMPHSPAPHTADQLSERTYYEAADSDSKEILNLKNAQTGADRSSRAYSIEEGIELPTLDPTSHKTQDCAPQMLQAGCKDSTTVMEKPQLRVADRESHDISEDELASKSEVEHAANEPHKASFLGKLIDKVTGKNK